MPVYHKLGKVPRKRHTVFKKADGSFHYEHLMGTYGFSGPASLLYHLRQPTEILSEEPLRLQKWEPEDEKHVRMRHFQLYDLPTGGTPLLSRIPLAYNKDVAISFVQPDKNEEFWFRNSSADEMIYIIEGEGTIESLFGEFPYRAGDHVMVPRGILYRMLLGKGPHKYVVFESVDYIRFPKRYLTQFGQLQEHSPVCERDILTPQTLTPHDEVGEFSIVVKRGNQLTKAVMGHHPLDVVGWDGYYYPWAINIEDFEPITGSLHQPPPAHQLFETNSFVFCNFVPRKFDYHPEAIPAPYNHSNVMSDEVLIYCNDQFMSRKGISKGSMTLHPYGLTHGPQPGKYEGSVGVEGTKELAIMIDTFAPLTVAKAVIPSEDESYKRSWI